MKRRIYIGICLLGTCIQGWAQTETEPSTPQAPLATDLGGFAAMASLVDTNHPFYHIASNVSTWSSLDLDPFDNQLFQVRFEKYINAAAATAKEDQEYQQIIRAILDTMAPHRVSAKNISTSFRLLPRASHYTIDAHLSDGIANAVYSVWLAQRNRHRLTRARKDLEEERSRLEWNQQMASRNQSFDTNNQASLILRMQPFVQRLGEVNSMMVKTSVKQELNELQTKLEFQSFLLQLFFQRRFQHVLISTRFYRHLFGDGDTALKLEGSSKAFFDQGTGLPPTVTTLDAIANEIMRDVEEAVEAYLLLLEKDELEAATRQLAQAFSLGEYLPPVRALPRETKRKVLAFTQTAGRLRSAMRAHDFGKAESLCQSVSEIARDFDLAGPLATIRTAQAASNMQLAKAKNAGHSGDLEGVEKALRKATEIWPLNPELTNLTTEVFNASDVRYQALEDLDQLLADKNYRRILDNQFRFAAAVAGDTNRQAKLNIVLSTIRSIEGAIERSKEFAKRGDTVGAWENAELAHREHPEDPELNRLRANLTTEAASFAQIIHTAKDLENREEDAASLAWYLKAQRKYPPSHIARKGIDRLVLRILPESSPAGAP